MITHAQRRGRDRRIRPLAPDAHRALDAYLREHRDLMTRGCCWADGLDPSRQAATAAIRALDRDR